MLEVTEIGRIEQFKGSRLRQPDGVTPFKDGCIIVADGGNDRLCLFDHDGNGLRTIGTHGYGRYAFKEPVAVNVAPDRRIFVSDWHNHRVVVFDEALSYVTEFGRYAPPANASKLYRLATFFQLLTFQGSYVERFHTESHLSQRPKYSLRQAIAGWRYWSKRQGGAAAGVRAIFADDERLLKPNGVAFVGDRIVVTDKDARCILWLAWDRQQLRQVDLWTGPDRDVEFGRLGNVLGYKDDSLFVCDERAHVIWHIDLAQHGFSAVKGEDSGTGVFLPFSCAAIDDHLLAVCGGLNFQIIDLRTQTVVYCSPSIGELHSIAYEPSTKRLMICNRSEHRIDIYRVTLA
ncbi:MAG: hypothetical protein M9965_05860 [Anaerolineae bacterium]|nr:hypothetical protein [Anaerolineae bacterium]